MKNKSKHKKFTESFLSLKDRVKIVNTIVIKWFDPIKLMVLFLTVILVILLFVTNNLISYKGLIIFILMNLGVFLNQILKKEAVEKLSEWIEEKILYHITVNHDDLKWRLNEHTPQTSLIRLMNAIFHKTYPEYNAIDGEKKPIKQKLIISRMRKSARFDPIDIERIKELFPDEYYETLRSPLNAEIDDQLKNSSSSYSEKEIHRSGFVLDKESGTVIDKISSNNIDSSYHGLVPHIREVIIKALKEGYKLENIFVTMGDDLNIIKENKSKSKIYVLYDPNKDDTNFFTDKNFQPKGD